jgi:hypothetical protein
MSIIVVSFFVKIGMKQNLMNKDLIEETFNSWNVKTIGSINDQLLATNNYKIKSILKKVIDVLKLSLYSQTADEKGVEDKGKPSRYKFLQTILSNHQIGQNFYIVETVIEGEVVQIKNYVIEDNISTSHVTFYYYFKNDWKAVRDTTIPRVDLHSTLKNANNGLNKLSGSTQSSVILSEFNSLNIKSHYYIPLSIESDNAILKILKL